MAQHPDYPFVSSFEDRHGTTRWRFRRAGKAKGLPGQPYSPEFDRAYQAVMTGRETTAEVVPFLNGVRPQSLKHAYQLLKATKKWEALKQKSARIYSRELEKLLCRKIGNVEIGDGPLSELKRTNVKQILQLYSATPHLQRTILLCLSKLIMIGIDHEWISSDPTYRMSPDYNPETDGHPPWTIEQMEQFERVHPIGSTARVAYALALWMGNRVSDVVGLRWDQFVTKRIVIDEVERVVDGFEFVQFKGRGRHKKGGPKNVFIPMSPWLERELAPLSRDTGFVLAWKGGRRQRGYAASYISAQMGVWAAEAGLPAGRDAGDAALGMHGLRKSISIRMAEADATTRQMMSLLGHSSSDMVELYSRKANQTRLAIQAMDKIVASEERRRKAKPGLKVVK